MNKKLFTCALLAASANTPGKPNEIKLASVGEWKGHWNGAFELKLEDLQQIKSNFEKQETEGVIDLDHATVFEGTGEAYGWIKSLTIKDDELWAVVEWLEHGTELIKSGKYKYISPVFQPNTLDQTSGDNIGWTLHSAALTNRPFFEDLGEVIANNKHKKQGDESMTKEEQQAQKIKNLEAANKTLKDAAAATETKRVEDEVDGAITANKVNKDQRDSLITLGKGNPDALTQMLEKAKVIVSKPADDVYANNNNSNQEKIDVLKLGGFTDA